MHRVNVASLCQHHAAYKQLLLLTADYIKLDDAVGVIGKVLVDLALVEMGHHLKSL